jgi:hypothetical protein
MLKAFQFDVPEGSHIYADKAYHDDAMEDVLLEASHIQLYPIRQKNSTRILPPYLTYIQHDYRKRIETVGSLIERMLPKTIHAVTAEGFELKVFLFVMAYSINCLEIATWVNFMPFESDPECATPHAVLEGLFSRRTRRDVPRHGGEGLSDCAVKRHRS